MQQTPARVLSILLGLGVPGLVLAAKGPVTLVEASVEAEASELSLPASMSGIITVRSCAACATQTFYFGRDPLLMLNGRKVDLQQFAVALRKAGNEPVSVYFRRSDSAVTRIVLAGVKQPEAAQ